MYSLYHLTKSKLQPTEPNIIAQWNQLKEIIKK